MKKKTKKTTTYKTIIKRSVLSIVITSIIIWFNLNAHAVYYVNHMPQKQDILVVAGVLAEQLPWLAPNTYEGYKTEPRYVDYLQRDQKGEREYINQFGRDNDGVDRYRYSYFEGDVGTYYVFNRYGKIISFQKNDEISYKISEEDKKEVKERVADMINPVIEEQPTPILNLQFLYNYLHKDDFK